MANTVTIGVKVKEQLSSELGGIVSTIGQLLGGAIIPLTGAVAALGVELVGAGAAAGAFGAAVAPQLSSIKQLSTEQDAYNKAVADYGASSSQAASAHKKLQGDMAQLTPATRDTANAFIDLKDKFGKWSDSLSGTTMPVFTNLLKGLGNVFPLLTPLVKAASAEFLGLSKRFEEFTKTDRFEDLVGQFSDFAAGALHNVVTFMERLAKAAVGFTTSDGFKNFLEQGKENLPGVANALRDLAEFVGRFVKAAGPLGGLQLKVFEILAETLNKIPTDVLETLVPLLLGAAAAMKAVKLAMMGFELIKGLVLGFQLLAGATLEVDAAMDANPIGAVVLALTALAFGLIEAYKHSKTFRDIVNAVGRAGKTAFTALVKAAEATFNWIKQHWPLIKNIILNPVGTAVSLVKSHWKQISDYGNTVVGWIRTGWHKLEDILVSPFTWAWGQIRSIGSKISSFISGIPGQVSSAVGSAVSSLNPSNWFAHGGVVGAAATGGPRNGLVMVGEQGPELVSLPSGSTVHSNPDTQRMMSSMGGGGGGRMVLEIHSGGTRLDDAIVEIIRKAVRVKGGNVQLALGQR